MKTGISCAAPGRVEFILNSGLVEVMIVTRDCYVGHMTDDRPVAPFEGCCDADADNPPRTIR
jgi:hypothetical protein